MGCGKIMAIVICHFSIRDKMLTIPPVFSGCGAAFNAKENNTSCFFLDAADKNMLLIDCGSTVFKEMASKSIVLDENQNVIGFGDTPLKPGDQLRSLFDVVDKLFVYITHTHCDHVGSLASLMDYFQWRKAKPVMLVVEDEEMKSRLSELLLLQNSIDDKTKVAWTNVADLPKYFPEIENAETLTLKHTTGMNSQALVLDFKQTDTFSGGLLFYTGDTSDGTAVKEFLAENRSRIFRAYIDVSTLDSSVHLNMETLGGIVAEVAPDIAHKIHCMHINDGITYDEYQSHARKYGFSVVKNWEV